MSQLSPHFTFAEMVATSQRGLAARNAAEAVPYTATLRALCETLLEPVRARFGPVSIHSGFRGPSLNAAIGGSKTSQHMRGEAADFHCPRAALDDVFRWIVVDSGLAFGQAILEAHRPGPPTWIHLSLGAPWRDAGKCGQALRYDGTRYTPWTP